MSPSSRRAIVLGVVLSSAAACGSETDPIVDPAGTRPSGSGTNGAVPATDACSFTLVNGGETSAWTGAPRARMNGSGNLLVNCVGQADGTSAETEVELHFGNGTFDGPRTYKADDFSSDGLVTYRAASGSYYSSSAEGGSCSLVLTEGPVDARGSSVPRGSRIAGTFTCASLMPPRAGQPALAIEAGTLSVVVE